MAPFEAAPAMVSNDRSFSAPVASRKLSSLPTTSSSLGSVCAASVPTQRRKRASAVPSRTCAWRAPSISTGFLQARGRAVGSAPRTTCAPARSSASKYQADEVAGSTSTRWPESAASAPARRSGASSVTPLPSQAGSSGVTLAGSRKRRAEPSAARIACDSGSGERITSPPRMLNSQALEAGAVISAASAPCSARLLPTRSRLAGDGSPANSVGCGLTGACGWAGRAAPQAASSGLGSTAFSAAPALAAADFSRSSASGLCSLGS